MKRQKKTALALAAVMLIGALTGCGDDSIRTDRYADSLSYEDAEAEIASMLKKVNVSQVTNPVLDIYSDEVSEAEALADISTFPITKSEAKRS